MILPVNNKFRITADSRQWIIQRSRKRKQGGIESKEWESFKYYSRLEDALNSLGEIMLRTSDAQTLAEALEEAKKISTSLSQALTLHKELVTKEKTAIGK